MSARPKPQSASHLLSRLGGNTEPRASVGPVMPRIIGLTIAAGAAYFVKRLQKCSSLSTRSGRAVVPLFAYRCFVGQLSI